MDKPNKPSETLPSSFGGVKENFSASKISTGYQKNIRDILGGANLNYLLDVIGKKDVYHDAICDYINAIPINKTPVTNSNNKLVYTQYDIKVYDATETYAQFDFVTGFVDGDKYIFKSLVDNNLGNALSDTNYWIRTNIIGNGFTRNIGEIVTSAIPLTDSGLHLLDGALIDGNGAYSEFVDYMAELYGDGTNIPSYFTTEANWQTSITNYGACEKFVYDSVNNTVRLPKTNLVHGPLINSYSNGYSWYRLYSDGWCEQGGVATENISTPLILPYKNTDYSLLLSYAFLETLDYSLSLRTKNIDSFVFAIHGDTIGTGTAYWRASGYTNYVSAERYSYIVIATTTKTNIQVDIDQIATDLNGKADVDLANCTKPHIVETYSNGASWYRVYSDGWCEQGGIGTENVSTSLLKSYIDTNYSVLLTLSYVDNYIVSLRSKTTSDFVFAIGNDTVEAGTAYWRASGYIR